MQVQAAQIFKDLDSKIWKPIYLIVGEEPFQIEEIVKRLKEFFVSDPLFQLERFDGDDLKISDLATSLNTMPSLFAEESSQKLVICTHFDKVSAGDLEVLSSYFDSPSPTTCVCLIAAKADRRKSWVKKVDEIGYSVEVREPYEKDFPKWQGYFEKKFQKSIDPSTWQRLVLSCQGSLSLIASEVEKLATYVADSPHIRKEDAQALTLADAESDPFAFTEDVLGRNEASSLRRYYALRRSGETDIKLVGLLVRQVRLVRECRALGLGGVRDTRAMGQSLGVNPFFVPKLQAQAKVHTERSLDRDISFLASCDYQLKTSGNVSLVEGFLLPYFQDGKTLDTEC